MREMDSMTGSLVNKYIDTHRDWTEQRRWTGLTDWQQTGSQTRQNRQTDRMDWWTDWTQQTDRWDGLVNKLDTTDKTDRMDYTDKWAKSDHNRLHRQTGHKSMNRTYRQREVLHKQTRLAHSGHNTGKHRGWATPTSWLILDITHKQRGWPGHRQQTDKQR